jgi:hypothetical protein
MQLAVSGEPTSSVMPVRPRAVLRLSGHATQLTAPVSFWKVSRSHSSHSGLEPSEKEPAAHGAHLGVRSGPSPKFKRQKNIYHRNSIGS